MGIIYSSSPIFIILISYLFFNEKINYKPIFWNFNQFDRCCCIIIIKADIALLIDLYFTSGDLWMLGASIGWALYTVYLFHWKSNLPLFREICISIIVWCN